MSKRSMVVNPSTDDRVQGFAPRSIWTGTSLDVSNVFAIRLASAASYQINAAGIVGTMPPGVTIIAPRVDSLDFTSTVTLEIM